MLVADVALQLGPFDLSVEIRAELGEVVALVGPNGAGKTTFLRAVAGLVPIDRGSVRLDDEVLDDPAAGIRVPTEERPIGYVFQDYLLFPHLTVLDNVAFGLRSRGASKADSRRTAATWLERVGLGDRGHARPRSLSGGQAQRVALARALATEPRLLLLDEPLAALDAATRLTVRADLRRRMQAFEGARLLVTHDPVDALVLADRLVVIEDGRIVQTGTGAEVSRRPRSDYVARLVGLNLYRGERDGEGVRLDGGEVIHAAKTLPRGPVFGAVRPQAVSLHRSEPHGSQRNIWPAVVAGIDAFGDRIRVELDGPVPIVAEITPAALADLDLQPGMELWAAVKATEVEVYPA